MALPEYEAKVWAQRFAAEFSTTPAPYYGVNMFEVNNENWDAVVENIRGQHAAVKSLGGRSHLWTVRDHGDRKQVCWIHYYPESIANTMSPEHVNSDEFLQNQSAFFNLIESYEWFCTSEAPSETPSLGPIKLALMKTAFKAASFFGLVPSAEKK